MEAPDYRYKIIEIENLLFFLVESKIQIKNEIITRFQQFKELGSVDNWKENDKTKFLIFLQDLSQEISPVQIDDISNGTIRNFKKYKKFYAILIVVILSIAVYVQTSIFKAAALIKTVENTSKIVETNKQDFIKACYRNIKKSTDSTVLDLKLKFTELDKSQIKYNKYLDRFQMWNIVDFYRTIFSKTNEEKKDSFNYFISELFDEYNFVDTINKENRTIRRINIDIVIEYFNQNETSKIKKEILADNNIQYNILNSYLLPFLFGMLGALLSLLRQHIIYPDKIKEAKIILHSPFVYLIVGGLAGIFISYFIIPGFINESLSVYSITLTTTGLSIFIGYNCNILFSLFDIVTKTFKTFFEKKNN